MNIKVTINEDSKDAINSINNLATIEDFAKMQAQSIVSRIHNNPIETLNSLREYNVITDEQYKELLINIRKNQVEEYFK